MAVRRQDAAGSWSLLLKGNAQQPYRLKTSADLLNWTELMAGTSAIDGSLTFTNLPIQAGELGRFFRALLGPRALLRSYLNH